MIQLGVVVEDFFFFLKQKAFENKWMTYYCFCIKGTFSTLEAS